MGPRKQPGAAGDQCPENLGGLPASGEEGAKTGFKELKRSFPKKVCIKLGSAGNVKINEHDNSCICAFLKKLYL